MRTTMRRLLLSAASLLSVLVMLGLSACSKGSEEKQAEGYYEGPMQPKSERVGSPAQQQGGQ